MASAADTLRTRQGDCEDVAILKLQLLLALGLPQDDAYFALVRDTMRGRDHAVTVVRLGGRTWLLDSTEDALVGADQAARSYRAVVAFSGTRKWILGTERQAMGDACQPSDREPTNPACSAVGQCSVKASPNALRTGLSR